jgi:hypothetical protein
MTKLEQLSQNLQNLQRKDRFYEITLRVAKEFEAYLIDLNQIQLSRGRDIFGESLGEYSAATQIIAERENPIRPKIEGQPYNFEWEGNFFAGMAIKFTSEYLEFTSTAQLADFILDKYSNLFGEQVLLGLTKDALDEFVKDKLTPRLGQYQCEILGLLN